MSSSVVCLSGGLDSCVTVARARAEGEVYALHLNYGQRTQARELRAFEEICDELDIEHRLVAEQPALGQVGGSALTDRNLEIPMRASGSEIPITYVPFRNAQILALATAWAEAVGAGSVWLGAVEEDGAGYPDCREAFFKAFATLIDCGTRPETQIAIRTPLLHLSKAEIVTLGLKLKAPLHLSWSCYAEEAAACGRCESCRLRLRAFEHAGVQDPIHYQAGYNSDSKT